MVFNYKYETLLDRLYSSVKVKGIKTEVFEMPKADVVVIGGYTVLRNFKSIVDSLRRNARHLQKYLLKELAAAGSVDESGALIIHGRFSSRAINVLLERYIKYYVKCPTCGSWHTVIKKKKKVPFLVCEACGAETSIKPV